MGRRCLEIFAGIWALCLPTLFASCGDVENEYSSHKAYLRFDNSTHLNTALSPALTGIGNSIFCRIYMTKPGQLTFQNNQGASEPETLSAKETNTPIMLGIENSSGIIVGYGYDNILYCYDACCPNCYDNGKTRSLLNMQTSGVATCNKCNRKYDMNNRGLSPEGGRLERYSVTFNRQTSVLTVNNHYY